MTTKLIRLFAGQAESSNGGKYTCYFNTNILNNVTVVTLKTLTFKNNHPNVFADDRYSINNNVFTYQVGAVVHTYAVPLTKFYSLSEILALLEPEIQNVFSAANPGSVASLTLNSYRDLLEVETAGALIPNPLSMLGNTGGTDGNGANTLNHLLGNFINFELAAGPNYFSTYPSLGGLGSVTAVLQTKSPQTILNELPDKLKHVNSIGVVPVNVQFGSMQTYTDPSPADSRLQFSYPEDLRQIVFLIRDELGRPILGQDLSLMMEIIVETSLM